MLIWESAAFDVWQSLQSLNDWMAAIDFWSAKKGNHARRSVIAADIVREMEEQAARGCDA